MSRHKRIWRKLGRKLKRSLVRKKITRVVSRGQITKRAQKAYGSAGVRKGWHSEGIVPGRTLVEWLDHPELGRGRVVAFLPGRRLDVDFQGVRPPAGVPIEDVRVLA